MLNNRIMEVNFQDFQTNLAKGNYKCHTFFPNNGEKPVMYIYDAKHPKEIIGAVETKKDLMHLLFLLSELYEIVVTCPQVLGLTINEPDTVIKNKFKEFFNQIMTDFKIPTMVPGIFQFADDKELFSAQESKNYLIAYLNTGSCNLPEISFHINCKTPFSVDVQVAPIWDRMNSLNKVWKYADIMEDKKVPQWLDYGRLRQFSEYEILVILTLFQYTDKNWVKKILKSMYNIEF